MIAYQCQNNKTSRVSIDSSPLPPVNVVFAHDGGAAMQEAMNFVELQRDLLRSGEAELEAIHHPTPVEVEIVRPNLNPADYPHWYVFDRSTIDDVVNDFPPKNVVCGPSVRRNILLQ